MTLILKLEYLYTKNEIPSCNGSKIIAQTDRHTDRQTDTQTDRQTQLKLLPIRMRGW